MCYGMQSWRYHNADVDGTTDAGEGGYRSTSRTPVRDLIGGRPDTTRLRGRGGEVSAVRNERHRSAGVSTATANQSHRVSAFMDIYVIGPDTHNSSQPNEIFVRYF